MILSMEVSLPASISAEAALAASGPEGRKRVRKWHHRGFTGCTTCRRRHVRCDEASPSCNNCTRLGLECDGTQGRMTFKVYGLQHATPESFSKPVVKRRGKNKATTVRSPGQSSEESESKERIKDEPLDDEAIGAVESVIVPPAAAADSIVKYCVQEHVYWPRPSNGPFYSRGDRYYIHFLKTVSTLLIIYDNPSNANPYRHSFPQFARSSRSLSEAMKALGALHLANTSAGQQRVTHLHSAMARYGDVVKSLRTRWTEPDRPLTLTDFATCLLLCLFEMMDSQSKNWRVHLSGARDIYRILFQSNHTDVGGIRGDEIATENTRPFRRFLVSLLSYLDVAGACATNEGTVVEGSYWETHGGGWEYNLGTPSFSPQPTATASALAELRQAWSLMMEIQAAISLFGKAKQRGMSYEQQDVVYNELLSRLLTWRANAPDFFHRLGDLDDESLRQYGDQEILEYTGCIEAYEKATIIYLHKVHGAGRPDRQAETSMIDLLVNRILSLIGKLAKGVGQLAVLWPLFIAGREARDESKHSFVRDMMTDMQRYGFNNIEKGLESLEKVWFKRRVFGDAWVDYMGDIQSSVLLP